MRTMQRLVVSVALTCCVLVASGVVASASHRSIRPGQHFAGLVNGGRTVVNVRTVCPGPAAQGSGPVAGGQTMAVVHVAGDHGSTGPFEDIYAWFVPATTGPKPVALHFRTYAAPMPIPKSIRVPCEGHGVVEFSSCPYLAPCAYGWTPYYVRVRFVNVAA
jgi:hypothetical protein